MNNGIGSLNKRVVLQAPTETQDAAGGPVRSYAADTATVWAAIEPLAGREWVEAQKINAEATGRVRIRHYSGLLPTWRVKYGTRTYDVLAVVNIEERGREMILYVKEAVI